MTKSFWQRLLVALIVTFYLRHKIISSFGDIIADPIIERGENNVDVDETTKEMGEAKPPPIEGKVPTCMTPQNEVCVKPYSVPQKVDCLVRKRQAIDSSGSWLLPEDFMYKFDRSFADAVLDRVISGSVLELGVSNNTIVCQSTNSSNELHSWLNKARSSIYPLSFPLLANYRPGSDAIPTTFTIVGNYLP